MNVNITKYIIYGNYISRTSMERPQWSDTSKNGAAHNQANQRNVKSSRFKLMSAIWRQIRTVLNIET